ncbi:MAG: lipocalin family protein [Flavobacteriales bacterium]|nr:lipocalin family protein [Flavobacteriales bacterium]
MTSLRLSLLFSIVLIIGIPSAWGQGDKDATKQLVGTWMLTRHTTVMDGQLTEHLTGAQDYFFEFFKDGTYVAHYNDKDEGDTKNEGKWRVIDNGKAISFYDNNPESPGEFPDYEVNILGLTDEELIMEEYLFVDDPIGKSYYQKK